MKITAQNAIGLYSDSSLSCIEASLINTDGVDIFHIGQSLMYPYPQELKEQLKALRQEDIADHELIQRLEKEITFHHITAVHRLQEQIGPHCPKIDIIGFPGHTILHQPIHHLHIKLGNPQEMANAFGCPVISSFTKADIRAGGGICTGRGYQGRNSCGRYQHCSVGRTDGRCESVEFEYRPARQRGGNR